jgi:hypothetical protein
MLKNYPNFTFSTSSGRIVNVGKVYQSSVGHSVGKSDLVGCYCNILEQIEPIYSLSARSESITSCVSSVNIVVTG